MAGMPKFGCALDQRFRLRGSGQKAEGAGRVKLDIFVVMSHKKQERFEVKKKCA
jgi:hypothetical protein